MAASQGNVECYTQRRGFEHEIPHGFVRWGEKCDWLEGSIPEESYLRCLAGEVYSPTRFYLNLVENWTSLEHFMKRLQVWVKDQLIHIHDLNEKSAAKIECMAPGLYVLCNYQDEWHRAVVMYMNNDDKNIITVDLMDYGTEVDLHIGQIRYMLKEMLYEYPPQAIRCRLQFDYPYDYILEKTGMVWPVEARDEFFGMINNKYLAVTFLERVVGPLEEDDTHFRGTWVVKVGLVAHEEGEGPIRPLNLVRVRREEYRKKYYPTAREVNSEDEERIEKLKEIDPTLPKHADGAFATAPKDGFADLSLHFLKYIERC